MLRVGEPVGCDEVERGGSETHGCKRDEEQQPDHAEGRVDHCANHEPVAAMEGVARSRACPRHSAGASASGRLVEVRPHVCGLAAGRAAASD